MPFWTVSMLSGLPNSFYRGVQLELAICETISPAGVAGAAPKPIFSDIMKLEMEGAK